MLGKLLNRVRHNLAIRRIVRRPVAAPGPNALDMLIEMLVRFEGFRGKAYLCSGKKWTYGYGSTFKANGHRVGPGDRITKRQAKALLRSTALTALAQSRAMLTGGPFNPVPEHHVAAVASLIYNVGPDWVIDSRFLKAYHDCDMNAAKVEYIDFNKAGGVELPGLTRRRETEWEILEKGI